MDDRCLRLSISSTHDSDITRVIEEVFSLLDVANIHIDINRDRLLIYESYHGDVKENSLAYKFPDIAKEWHPTKNAALKPNMVYAGTNKKVWWICKNGHEYDVAILARTYGSGCPYCANKKILPGYNDLKTTHSEIVAIWHPIRNKNVNLEMISEQTKRKYWWLGDCGHEWQAVISSRHRGTGCPFCKGEKIAQKSRKRVLNIDTNEVFDSVKEAAEKYQCTSGNISQCCSGKSKTAKGYRWKYLEY